MQPRQLSEPVRSRAETGAGAGRRTRRGGWHVAREADGLTLARHWPPRFDVSGRAVLAGAAEELSLTRLAHQVRQDLWRALQSLRGFSPVVRLTRCERGIEIVAGGRAAAPIPAGATARIEEVLSDPRRNDRWIKWAKQGKRS
jgi:non-ribosomal peptide synthetase component F